MKKLAVSKTSLTYNNKTMEVQNLPLTAISPSSMNPRKTFDESAIQELADNISTQGLLQPITVRPIDWDDFIDDGGQVFSTPFKYEIVCGERRFRAYSLIASKNESVTNIPCIVREMSDEDAYDAMITENLQRKDVDPIEEAFAFGELVKRGQKAEDIAARFGKSERYINDRIKLSALVPKAAKALRDERLTIAGAMLVCRLDAESQEDLIDDMPEEGLSTSAVKREIANMQNKLATSPIDVDREYNGFQCTCRNCPNNTCNHGCLFYEMNASEDDARCTNDKCFERKKEEALLQQILEYGDKIAKINDDVFSGKYLIYTEGDCNPNMKEVRDRIFNRLREETDYRIGKFGDILSYRCWYNVDDERVTEGVENREYIVCITLDGWCDLKVKAVAFNVRKTESENCKAIGELNRKINELRDNTASAIADEIIDAGEAIDFEDGEMLSNDEEIAFYTSLAVEFGCDSIYSEVTGNVPHEATYTDKVTTIIGLGAKILNYKDLLCRLYMKHHFANKLDLKNSTKRMVPEMIVKAMYPDALEFIDEARDKYSDEIKSLQDKINALKPNEQ